MRRRRESPAAPRATYTEWWWPPSPTIYRTMAGGYRSFEHQLVVEVEPRPGAAYVWAHGFSLLGGDGGHLALEVGAEGGGAERTAAFSIRGADVCRISYPWQVGRAYDLQLWADGGGWWSAGVGDDAGAESLNGRIQVPAEWRRLAGTSVMSSEYCGGPLARCADLAPSRVRFSPPTADEGTVHPVRHETRLGPGSCPGSSVEVTAEGVRHVMGGPT